MTESVRNHPLRDLIAAKGSVVIDGAMSTALESLGCNLNDSLWSAKILAEDPEKIYEVHRRYYEAGADVAITASYQASEAGFKAKGIGAEKAAELIALSVTLARKRRPLRCVSCRRQRIHRQLHSHPRRIPRVSRSEAQGFG